MFRLFYFFKQVIVNEFAHQEVEMNFKVTIDMIKNEIKTVDMAQLHEIVINFSNLSPENGVLFAVSQTYKDDYLEAKIISIN